MEFYQCPAEDLPFEDASFDTVVSSLVFCSVRDVPLALAEIKRILKPQGVCRFIEHVRAEGRDAGKVQDILTPAWRWFGAGCHLNRDTVSRMESAEFEIVEMRRKPLPLIPLVVGMARSRG